MDNNIASKKLTIPKKRHHNASLDAKKARAGYFFVLPFLVGILFIYLPILIDSITFSFTEMGQVTEMGGIRQTLTFVGFEHYKHAFTTDPNFVTTLITGLQNLIFEVPAIVIFSLFIAVVLNQKMLGRAVFRAIFFVPVIIATGIMENLTDLTQSTAATDAALEGSAAAAEGSNQASGASQIISVLDVQALLSNMKVGVELVSYVVDLVNNIYNIINYSGVQMLIFLAGLQSISPQIYEACRIDGATGWETFWKVTFPMISPMILVNAVYTVIDSFTRSTNVVMVYIKGIEGGIGGTNRASAMYWVYFLAVILIIALVGAIMSSFIFYQRRD